MAVRRVSRVTRPRQEEPDQRYGGGGPGPGSEPGSGESTGGDKKKKKGPLRPKGFEFPPGHYGSRADPKWKPGGRFGTGMLQYMPMRPGYLKYFDNDVSAPLIAGRGNPGLIAELQRRLVAVGLISGKAPRGIWDPKTEKGYRRLLEIANVWGMSDQAALDLLMAENEGIVVTDDETGIGRRTSDGSGEGGRGPGFRIENGEFVPEGPEAFVPPPLELRLPNPDDVDRVMRNGSITLLGQGLDQQSVEAMRNAYIQEVTRLQRSAYDQMVQRERQLWETGETDIQEITTVEAPSAETFAENQLRQRPEAQSNTGMELLMNLINSWG
jgi:hypothetical protein